MISVRIVFGFLVVALLLAILRMSEENESAEPEPASALEPEPEPIERRPFVLERPHRALNW